jgi:hypothetical protein
MIEKLILEASMFELPTIFAIVVFLLAWAINYSHGKKMEALNDIQATQRAALYASVYATARECHHRAFLGNKTATGGERIDHFDEILMELACRTGDDHIIRMAEFDIKFQLT